MLAAMLLGLLLIQPALCVIHCSTAPHHSSGAPLKGSQGHLICSLSDTQAPQSAHIPVPAFWPSLPAGALIIMAPAALLLVLPLLAVIDRPTLAWSPPIPPPRHS